MQWLLLLLLSFSGIQGWLFLASTASWFCHRSLQLSKCLQPVQTASSISYATSCHLQTGYYMSCFLKTTTSPRKPFTGEWNFPVAIDIKIMGWLILGFTTQGISKGVQLHFAACQLGFFFLYHLVDIFHHFMLVAFMVFFWFCAYFNPFFVSKVNLITLFG